MASQYEQMYATAYPSIVNALQQRGMSPNLAPFVFSHMMLESGNGTVTAPGSNNYFGIQVSSKNATPENSVLATDQGRPRHFRKFNSLEDGIGYTLGLVSRYYPNAAKATNIVEYAQGLQSGLGGRRYAEAPNYVEAMVNRYNSLSGLLKTNPMSYQSDLKQALLNNASGVLNKSNDYDKLLKGEDPYKVEEEQAQKRYGENFNVSLPQIAAPVKSPINFNTFKFASKR